jgi:type I restriction enzyme S subunit
LYINKTMAAAAISDHAIRLEPTSVGSGYLYAYLMSKCGQALVDRGSYGSTVDELEPRHLADIPVPRLGKLEGRIDALVLESATLRDEAQELFDAAENELHDQCGISLFTEYDIEYLSDELPRSFVVRSFELGGRFDASHHVPVARSAVHKLEAGTHPLVRLGDTSATVFRPERFKRVYVGVEYGIPFFQPSFVPLYRPQQYKYISQRANADVLPDCMLVPDSILVTRSGTAGRCCFVTEAFAGWAGSDDLLRIIAGNDWDPAFLAAFFMTPYARHQILAEVYGGVIDHVDEAHLEGVLCPSVPLQEQQRTAELVRDAYAARDRANNLEDEALGLVDDAILRTGDYV